MKCIQPDWNIQRVNAYCTLRYGGVSQAPYDSLNLGDHVGDDNNAVLQNRTLLAEHLNLPTSPCYLSQIHSTRVVTLPTNEISPQADAVYTQQPNQVCLVMTADCLPLLVAANDGSEVAAIHAGWRGLCDGIIEQTLTHFSTAPANLQVWLGPAIGPQAFQVGEEVLEQFIAQDADASLAFQVDHHELGKYFADIYQLARQRLTKLGVKTVLGGGYCTFSDPQFFSYRRDQRTGRMASLIWISP